MGYKVFLNYLLWRIGVRNVLPGAIVNRVPVVECGEGLVLYKGALVRAGVADRLKFAESLLPKDIHIKILSGFRSLAEQRELWDKTPDRRLVADPAFGGGGHQTGGAVDVILCDQNGCEMDMGCAYLTFDGSTPTNAVKNKNREILYRAMIKAGFANYPNEWWHFSHGDKMWAAYMRKKNAIYGAKS